MRMNMKAPILGDFVDITKGTVSQTLKLIGFENIYGVSFAV